MKKWETKDDLKRAQKCIFTRYKLHSLELNGSMKDKLLAIVVFSISF